MSDSANTFFDRLFGQFRRQSAVRVMGVQRDKERLLMQSNERLKETLRDKERDLERFRAAFDAMDEAVILLDSAKVVVYMNTVGRDWFGTPEEFIYSRVGQTLFSLDPPPDDGAEAVPMTPPQRIEHQDQTYVLRAATVSSGAGKPIGMLALVKQVTGEQVSQRLRTHFIRSISHELKTPLAKIKGTADLISTKAGDSIAVEQMVEALITHVDVLDRMVVEMLDLAEIGAGTFLVTREPVHIDGLLNSIVRSLLDDIQKAELEIVLMVRDAARLVIEGDETRLRWAVGHLLRNSIQYTEPKGSIMVVAGLDEEDSTRLTIDVIDSGVGISDDDLPRIFERFYRGRPISRHGRPIDPRGLGQGLYIAKSVAEAHGGILTVRTTVGEGSIFSIMLPAKQTH